MCCLKFESEAYQDLLKTTPKTGAYVKTAEGKGVVTDVNLLTGTLKVKIDKSDNLLTVNKKDVEVIKDSVIRVDKNEMRALKQLEGK